MFFGYGETICPNCYEGEQPYIFFEESYWLNRIIARLLNLQSVKKPTITKIPPMLFEMEEEIEVF